ncbi:MAG: hypothetical protein LBD73_06705 [Deferribacteraceae bacterium]|jgi:hypothetical protein|nr:hypothetical protein [Deferribacteraceae bacterium]
MGSILRELYHGQISPRENGFSKNREHAAAAKMREALEVLSKGLDNSGRENLNRLEGFFGEVLDLEKAEAFALGFKIAIRIMCETFGKSEPSSDFAYS